MSGIFIAKGMTFSIPAGSLSINQSEPAQSTIKEIHVGFDVLTPWLEISLAHLKSARSSNEALLKVWQSGDPTIQGELLRAQYKESVQSMTAAAFALDAFYFAIKPKIGKVPKAKIKNQQRGRSRHAHVAETLKIAFQQSDEGFATTSHYLESIFSFRDRAVHPTNSFAQPIMHPELKVGVEWRFISYRYEAALPLLFVTLEIIGQLVSDCKPINDEVGKYAEYLRSILPELRSDNIFADLRQRSGK